MATPIPTAIGEFNSQVEDWQSYTERLQQYFIAAGVTIEAEQRAILLKCMWCRLIHSLSAPTDLKDTSLADLIKLMLDYFQPKPSVTVQRFK